MDRDDTASVHESANVFDDAFAVQDDVVADGLRHGDRLLESQVSHENQPEIRTVAAHYAPSARLDGSVSSSLQTCPRKSTENPFSVPEDEDVDQDARMPMLTFETDLARRSGSSASSRNFAHTSSLQFTSGPSHPYGAYPQGTIARSPSTATSSTARAPYRHSSMRHNAPQHPYTLYPQGVGDEGEDDDDNENGEGEGQNLVPVGFPGHQQTYRRQRGPDGEEQDFIGVDGHAEPLPPYSRYPEDGPPKQPLLVPDAPSALHSRAPVAGTDPGMPLMHTSIQAQSEPAPESMSDASALLRSSSQEQAIETSPRRSTERKAWSEKTWKERRRTRCCCCSCWCCVIITFVILFIAGILGGALAGWLFGLKHAASHIPTVPSGASSASTSLYDASAISSTATVLPPTGTFALSLSTPQVTQAECLARQSQQAAWSCAFAGEPKIMINVGTAPKSKPYGASISFGSNNTQVSYGTQPASMVTQFASFLTVMDNDDPNYGPALYFQSTYNKIVVVPENALNLSSRRKRQYFTFDQSWLTHKELAQPGDKPWFCVWNNTFLEGFIYMQQSVSPSYTLTAGSSASTVASSSAGTTSTASTTPTTSGWTSGQGPPASILTTTYSDPTTTAVFSGPATQYAAWSSGMAHQQHQKRTDQCLYDTLPLFPYVVKLEERRLSGNTVTPYCQQMQILDNGGYGPVAGPNNSPTNLIQLVESDPPYSAYQNAGIAGGSRKMLERRLVPGGCHCQWISGQ